MKKLLLLTCTLLLLTGCVRVKDANIDTLLSGALTSNVTMKNVNREGYSYYLPRGLKVSDSTDYNEVIRDAKYKYYLYVDVISYFNKIKDNYKVSDKAYISKKINYDNKNGYLEINEQENSKYLIEIMYNYAKIEVMVDMDDINEAVTYAISILSSVTYNDNVISNLIGEDVLNFAEENFNIFETVSSDSNYLKYEEEYKYVEEEIPDTDLIN